MSFVMIFNGKKKDTGHEVEGSALNSGRMTKKELMDAIKSVESDGYYDVVITNVIKLED